MFEDGVFRLFCNHCVLAFDLVVVAHRPTIHHLVTSAAHHVAQSACTAGRLR